MIPVSLTIEGIYSYKNRTSIDFRELCSDCVFGIFGAVGSGKSALLEAMIYAIYGQTERMNRNDRVSANMLNLSTNEMYIEFSFTAKNQLWTAIRQLKRRKSQKQEIESFASFYKTIDNEQIPATLEELQKAVGLSYENFRRVIIIPQGKFQEFLQLGDTDRSQMMMELFPELRKFDLFDKTNSLLIETNTQITAIEEVMYSIGEIDVSQVTDKENSIKEKELQQQLLKTQEEVLIKQEFYFAGLKQLADKLLSETKSLEELQSKNSTVAEYEKTVNTYELCVNVFKTDITAFDQTTDEIKKIDFQLQQYQASKQKTVSEQQQLVEELIQITPLYEKRQQMAEKASEFLKIGDILKAKAEQFYIQKNLLEQETKLHEKMNLLTQLKEQQQSFNTDIIHSKSNLFDEEVLNAFEKWFSEYKFLKKNEEEAQKTVELQKKEWEKIQGTVALFSQNKIFASLILPDYEAMLAAITQYREENEQQKFQKEEQQQALLIRHEFAKHSQQLKEGEPCPLCGATEHPNIVTVENNDADLTKLKIDLAEISKTEKEIQNLLLELNRIEANMKNAHKNIDIAHQRLQKNQELLVEHKRKIPQSPFTPEKEQEFLQTVERNRELKKNIQQKENLKVEIEKKAGGLDLEIKQEEQKNNELKKQIANLEGAINAQNNALKLLEVSSYKDFVPEQLKKMSTQLLEQQKEVETTFESLSKKKELNNNQIATFDGILQTESARLHEKTQLLEQQKDLLTDKLSQHTFPSLDEIRSILRNEIDTQKIRERIVAHREKLHTALQNCKMLQEQIGENKYEAQQHEELKQQLLSKKQELETLNQEIGKTRNELTLLRTNLERQEKLKKELKQQQIRKENLTELKSLFTGAKFVKFVSTLYLQEMCKAANERFMAMTKNKLRLELNENANFIIRDFMNEGKTRNVKTLSGGQTFQAALSLALAMTDNLPVDSSAKSFFFLDEGFGSLDRESLRIVFDTLQSLRNENRIVGLISHVEELKNEMNRYLIITNDENGSKIEKGWEMEE